MVYAFIWKSSAAQEEFERRVPGLMKWLEDLHQKGCLRGCGGWVDENGGLTLIEANSKEEAQRINDTFPLNDIGTTEIFAWDIFYADLVVKKRD